MFITIIQRGRNLKKEKINFISMREGLLLDILKENLSVQFKGGKIKSFLEHRQVSINGVVSTKYNHPVHKGDEICIYLSHSGNGKIPFEVIYEDDYLIAINKPSGLLSVATDSEKENTAFRILKECGKTVFVAHRLDRDTSGVLLFAKSREVKEKIQKNWNSTLYREYIAVCEGVFKEKSGRVESYLKESKTHIVYSDKFGKNGKKAITNYKVIKENKKYTMLKINIETGRKNQIRVAMKEMGHPVAGDRKYGALTNPFKRLGLHASVLKIIHPVTERVVVFEAKIPRCFTSL